jgi:hypothetical protein
LCAAWQTSPLVQHIGSHSIFKLHHFVFFSYFANVLGADLAILDGR